jgi:uncharacterized membrane protein
MKTIFGIFDDPLAARRAMEMLRDGPLPLEDVSIISRTTESGAPVSSGDDVSAGEGAVVGAVWGGLVGLAALLIPGIGPFVAGGALFAAITGAVTGAVVGGVAAALIDFSGIPEAEAREYEKLVYSGQTLVVVKAHDEDAPEARRLLMSSGAETVRGAQPAQPTQPAHVAMYDEHGRRVDQDAEYAVGGTATRGIYDMPARNAQDHYTTPAMSPPGEGRMGESWTRGEDVGAGQGAGPRKDTGIYDARQWVGEGQGPADQREGAERAWTSGEWVGEGQGAGPRTDTGTYDAQQWAGEGQDDDTRPDDLPKQQR